MTRLTAAALAARPRRIHDYHDQPRDPLYRALILLGFALMLWASWRYNVFHGVLHYARHHEWGRFLVAPAILWGAMGLLMLLVRTLLWFAIARRRSRLSTAHRR